MLHSTSLLRHTLRGRTVTIWLTITFIVVLLRVRNPWSLASNGYLKTHIDDEDEFSCKKLQGLEDIFLILRTGANDVPRKLPIHFNTTLRCLPETSYGIWSDLEEEMDGYHVENALDDIDTTIVANHPDFEYYRSLQQDGRAAFSDEQYETWNTASNTGSGRDTPAWKLDKWKFLPLAGKAYGKNPNAKWFIYMECDSYVHWASMLKWLSKIDATKKYYMGQQMQIGGDIFAYGGSTIVISNPAMKALVDHYSANVQSYEQLTSRHWAGDCILGKALKGAGVELSWLWPTFFSEMPFNMDFNGSYGSTDARPWCFNAMTYHHANPSDIDEFFRFEHRWNQDVSPQSLRFARLSTTVEERFTNTP
jgi:hypothetical protein